jgi:hypothetical protein
MIKVTEGKEEREFDVVVGSGFDDDFFVAKNVLEKKFHV